MRRKVTNVAAAALIVAAAALAFHSVLGQDSPVEKEVLLIVDGRQAWPDCRLSQLLTNRLSEHNFLKLADPRLAEELPHYPAGVLPRAQLMRLGQHSNCRFIVWCAVDQEKLVRENNFSIPLVAKQRRVTAKLKARYYVLDCERQRIIHKGDIDARRHGPSSLQLVDFGDADPELLVPYSEQEKLFCDLETEAATKIESAFLDVAKLR
jgi:hypothetical protein